MSDDGLAYVCPQGSALIASYDVPLFYFGEMAHHPIRLCDNRPTSKWTSPALGSTATPCGSAGRQTPSGPWRSCGSAVSSRGL